MYGAASPLQPALVPITRAAASRREISISVFALTVAALLVMTTWQSSPSAHEMEVQFSKAEDPIDQMPESKLKKLMQDGIHARNEINAAVAKHPAPPAATGEPALSIVDVEKAGLERAFGGRDGRDILHGKQKRVKDGQLAAHQRALIAFSIWPAFFCLLPSPKNADYRLPPTNILSCRDSGACRTPKSKKNEGKGTESAKQTYCTAWSNAREWKETAACYELGRQARSPRHPRCVDHIGTASH